MNPLARRCDICARVTDDPCRRGDGTCVCRECIGSAVRRVDERADEAAYRRAVALRLRAIAEMPCHHTRPVLGCYGGCWTQS